MELAEAVVTLRAAGCAYAEDEADVIWSTFPSAAERDDAVAARSAGMPLEQVVGWAEFGGVRVALAPGVFVPRRRAEAILAPAVTAQPGARVVVDLGCGAGALAASLAALLPDADVHGLELDPAAAACARRTGGFTVHEGTWWSGLPTALRGRVDLAVAYLPHVPTPHLADIHPDFRAHEPALSVDGGADGLDALREVRAGLDAWLAPDGVFVTLLAREQVPEDADVLAEDDDDVVVAFRPSLSP